LTDDIATQRKNGWEYEYSIENIQNTLWGGARYKIIVSSMLKKENGRFG
jgi:hypothetical protein